MSKDLLWGLLFGALFLAVSQVVFHYIEGPVPYTDVHVESLERTDAGYIVDAHFLKTDCTFVRLEAFGINTGVPLYLDWVAEDGSPARDYDRSLGFQRLVILVKDGGKDYETIELRTRHDCDGVFVDKVFATINT